MSLVFVLLWPRCGCGSQTRFDPTMCLCQMNVSHSIVSNSRNKRETHNLQTECYFQGFICLFTSWAISLSTIPSTSPKVISFVVSLPMKVTTIIPPDTSSSKRDFKKVLKSIWNLSKYASYTDGGLVLARQIFPLLNGSPFLVEIFGAYCHQRMKRES